MNEFSSWKLTPTQKQILISAYQCGASVEKLAKQFSVNRGSISGILRRVQVLRKTVSKPFIRLTPTQKEIIISAYQCGIAVPKLAVQFSVSRLAIYRLLRKRDILRRNSNDLSYYGSDRPHPRRHTLNEAAFDTITEESAYWIGFLMADGCVHLKGEKKHPWVSLGLAEHDRGHIVKFRDFLGSTHKIDTITQKGGFKPGCRMSRFSVGSRKLTERLAFYGIVPRKTHIAQVMGGLENNRHFWRGFIDGDGHIGFQSRSIVSVGCASRVLLEQFRSFCQTIIPITNKVTIKKQPLFLLQIRSLRASAIIRTLYSDCSVFLDRKKKEAERILLLDQERDEHYKQKLYRHFAYLESIHNLLI